MRRNLLQLLAIVKSKVGSGTFSQKTKSAHLTNLKFLREYHSAMPDQALIDQVVNYLHNVRDSVTVESLLQGLCKTENDQLYLAPTVWQLITVKRITIDLQLPLTMKSKLSLFKET